MSETNYTENDLPADSTAETESDIITQIREVELRSDEVQEIMGYIPHWIIRWGITIIFLVIIFILTGSYFFKYPDIITSQVVLTTQNPPAGLMARTTGKIQALFVKDNQKVSQGDHIAVLETATDYHHLMELKSQVIKLKPFFNRVDAPLPKLELRQDYSLGELQSSYASFFKSYEDFRNFFQLGYYDKKIKSTNEQIIRHKEVYNQMERQVKIGEQDLELVKEQHERNIQLFNDKIISQTDIENSKSRYLQKQMSVESQRTSLSNAKIQISTLEQTIMDLEMNRRTEINRLHLALNQAYEVLFGHISTWIQSYLLIAPTDGVVTFNKFWSTNQNVKAGERVFTIIPEKGGDIIGKVQMPIMGSGKVKVGQAVNIKLVNYPHNDFGILRGKIKSISLVATTEGMYSVEIILPKGLLTSYDKTLEFSQEMQGTAEIITEDVRLLERILKPLKTMLTKDKLDEVYQEKKNDEKDAKGEVITKEEEKEKVKEEIKEETKNE